MQKAAVAAVASVPQGRGPGRGAPGGRALPGGAVVLAVPGTSSPRFAKAQKSTELESAVSPQARKPALLGGGQGVSAYLHCPCGLSRRSSGGCGRAEGRMQKAEPCKCGVRNAEGGMATEPNETKGMTSARRRRVRPGRSRSHNCLGCNRLGAGFETSWALFSRQAL